MKIRNPFTFKKFTLEQKMVTLPVTTDACLFGAYCNFESPKRILDVGTGTGLLAFMMHQKYPHAQIIGLEKHAETALQAGSNIQLNQFPNIEIEHTDFFDFSELEKFDGIISNPPFFTNQLESQTDVKNQARHLQEHTFADFFKKIALHLNPLGSAWILLPYSSTFSLLGNLSTSNLFVQKQLIVFPNPHKKAHLIAVKLGFQNIQNSPFEEVVYLRNENNKFSNEALNLLKPFYLDQALNT